MRFIFSYSTIQAFNPNIVDVKVDKEMIRRGDIHNIMIIWYKYNIHWLYEMSVSLGIVWDLQKQMINVYFVKLLWIWSRSLCHLFKSQFSFQNERLKNHLLWGIWRKDYFLMMPAKFALYLRESVTHISKLSSSPVI